MAWRSHGHSRRGEVGGGAMRPVSGCCLCCHGCSACCCSLPILCSRHCTCLCPTTISSSLPGGLACRTTAPCSPPTRRSGRQLGTVHITPCSPCPSVWPAHWGS